MREPGEFRSMQVGVYQGMRLIHAGAPPSEVPGLMNQVFEWGLLSNLHPLIKSCIMHFAIEYVHPFQDGNGRMGRLWQTVVLADWRDALQWVPIETMVHRNQTGYYEALRVSEQVGDAGFFAGFMLDVIESTLLGIIESREVRRGEVLSDTVSVPVDTVNDTVTVPVDTVNGDLPGDLNEAILLLLASSPALTLHELAARLGKSRSTVIRRIRVLRLSGQVSREGPDKTGVWVVKDMPA